MAMKRSSLMISEAGLNHWNIVVSATFPRERNVPMDYMAKVGWMGCSLAFSMHKVPSELFTLVLEDMIGCNIEVGSR